MSIGIADLALGAARGRGHETPSSRRSTWPSPTARPPDVGFRCVK